MYKLCLHSEPCHRAPFSQIRIQVNKVYEGHMTKQWKQDYDLMYLLMNYETKYTNKRIKQKNVDIKSILSVGHVKTTMCTVCRSWFVSYYNCALSWVIFNNSKLLVPASFSQGRQQLNNQKRLRGENFYSDKCNK